MYLKQAIGITGLGTPTFANALDAAQEIYGHFNQQFMEGILETWSCSGDTEGPWIDVSNRYLTPIRDAQDVESIPFDKGINPYGILQDMARGDGSCSSEHIILFKQTKTYIRLATFRFNACEPQMFHVGDIMQLQLSFVTVPVKGGH
ncbi:hypothetical protein L208DRAFT_1260445 [Tricholoma matsutake]|nr:hypothetical protein L208DRAFT_1260445 [Tricholoma matsutake 945]